MTDEDHENYAMNLAAEAFPNDSRNQEQRDGDRLREFLLRQYSMKPKPKGPVFEDE